MGYVAKVVHAILEGLDKVYEAVLWCIRAAMILCASAATLAAVVTLVALSVGGCGRPGFFDAPIGFKPAPPSEWRLPFLVSAGAAVVLWLIVWGIKEMRKESEGPFYAPDKPTDRR